MKICIENLGIIKQAIIEPSDITVICGKNNTGKTYATYAYYGFLDFIKNTLAHHVSEILDLTKIDLTPLKTKGILTIDLQSYLEQYKEILKKTCEIYTYNIPEVFVARKDRFQNTKFSVHLDKSELKGVAEFKLSLTDSLIIESKPDAQLLQITKIQNADIQNTEIQNTERLPLPEYLIKEVIAHTIIRSIFQPVFGSYVFIASVERTGASIFKKELYLNRNRIVERLGESSKTGDIDIRDVLFNSYSPYPLPVKNNVAFIQELPPLTKKSWLAEEYPEILLKFSEIVGGTYSQDKEGELLFIPMSSTSKSSASLSLSTSAAALSTSAAALSTSAAALSTSAAATSTTSTSSTSTSSTSTSSTSSTSTKSRRGQPKLQLTESSSVVRALIHLDYYLRYKANKGDILIIDEPELNLHPENQRKIARVFARLANVGIKVFVTTHSDYIVKELGLLVMLSRDTETARQVLNNEKYGYEKEDVIEENKIRVYIADKTKNLPDGKKSRTYYHTLIPASVSKERGIELYSFDDVINLMNEIQNELFWGE